MIIVRNKYFPFIKTRLLQQVVQQLFYQPLKRISFPS